MNSGKIVRMTGYLQNDQTVLIYQVSMENQGQASMCSEKPITQQPNHASHLPHFHFFYRDTLASRSSTAHKHSKQIFLGLRSLMPLYTLNIVHAQTHSFHFLPSRLQFPQHILFLLHLSNKVVTQCPVSSTSAT